MSLVNLAHVCSHLQNASKARLSTTSVPLSKLHLALALQLQKAGVVSTVTIAGSTAPMPSPVLAHPPSSILPPSSSPSTVAAGSSALSTSEISATNTAAHSASLSSPSLAEATLQTNTASQVSEEPETAPAARSSPSALPSSLLSQLKQQPLITQENRASRRIWLGLKYWNNRPVLSKMGMVSKPTRRITMGVEALSQLARGERSGYVHGVRGIGELLFVSTDRGVMEVRECVERGMGGLLLCRAM